MQRLKIASWPIVGLQVDSDDVANAGVSPYSLCSDALGFITHSHPTSPAVEFLCRPVVIVSADSRHEMATVLRR